MNTQNTPPQTRPFNLQDFLAGKPIVCRNGFVPTDAHYFEKAKQILFTANEVYIIRNDNNGNSHIDTKYDLFHPCEQKEGWLNLYKDEVSVVYTDARVFESEELSLSKISQYNYLTTIKITWYE